jgi:acetyl esterase
MSTEQRTWDRIVRTCMRAAVRASMAVSPKPAALLVRKVFSVDTARQARTLEAHAPKAVSWVLDERYGEEPEARLDVFRPAAAAGPLPMVLWVHGGAWFGGSKGHLAGYFKLLASHGYVVVAPSYSLAPEQQLRQLSQAIAYTGVHAERFGIDSSRIVLGGDSAGARLAAQLAALVTASAYGEALGVTPAITPDQLRGVVLACGAYDLAGTGVVSAVLWAVREPRVPAVAVTDHITHAFPPALITVGNADPLKDHSEQLVETLRARGGQPETLFFHEQHTPSLGHEYQFDLETEEAWRFLERMVAFLRRRVVARA